LPRRSLPSELTTARTSLRQLQKLLDRLAKEARALELAAATNGSPVRGTRRKMTITPKRRAQLKLQGQYMGYMRQLKPRQKTLARAAKEKGGYRAGIKKARGAGGKVTVTKGDQHSWTATL
jgi:hypothetical protein